ncbi:nucleotidyltransferase family protein [Terriglobus aquaticus]|uniref:NTP transferase domain-containing protein n=1 Tax=Terriglobus aquaticus TaxID=940139 RepID=A0ABW9KGV5_9BACT|nr:nucleotidyltransferase family protein [Terriglobus aquaticus]
MAADAGARGEELNEGRRHLGALILAAGASTRLGQPKQMVRWNGETLVERAVRIAREAGAETVLVVLGAHHEQIFPILQPYQPELRILLNQRWAEGMGTSIALGAAVAERHSVDDLLVLTCDQVAVTAQHLRDLVAASHREHVVASTYAGRRGVPALFPEFSFHALQRLSGDRGARDLLQHEDVVHLPLPGGELDIDTPEDLEQLTAPGVSEPDTRAILGP